MPITRRATEDWNSKIARLPDDEHRFMLAKEAYHVLGDVSRDEVSVCWIYGEMKGYWIGNWIDGPGFARVRFPKKTTQEIDYVMNPPYIPEIKKPELEVA